jgi:hypothetical protein
MSQAEILALLKLMSVTTILKVAFGTSDPLVNWIAKAVAEASIDSRATVETMLANEGREAAIRWVTQRRFERSSRAMERGSALHAVFEAYALGKEPPPVEEPERPYVEQFLGWLDRFRPEFVMAEAPVYNVVEQYAGTLDGVMKLAGIPLLFDYKTTEHPPGGDKSRPPFPEVALQLVAYRRATEVGVHSEQRYSGGRRYYLYDPSAKHEPMPEVEGALCIVVSPFDCEAYPIVTDDTVWRFFKVAREAARWQLSTSQGVIRPPLVAPTNEAAA